MSALQIMESDKELDSTNLSTTNFHEDEDLQINITKRRFKRFSESDSDSQPNSEIKLVSGIDNHNSDIYKKCDRMQKTRVLKSYTSSESDEENPIIYRKKKISRTENKKTTLHNKFKSLHSYSKKQKNDDSRKKEDETGSHSSNDTSNDELIHMKEQPNYKEQIQNINISSLCDPDVSDEDENSIDIKKLKIKTKSKPTESKLRMSAKQAMENMQKIKSESNRMIREKDVSLPYHKPKALSLKDIMSRRKPAVSSDGKSLPIKMNNEQLKHYAMLLDQRQKEMIELCKSDTEDENDCIDNKDLNEDSVCNKDTVKDVSNGEICIQKQNNSTESLSNENDMSFDQIISEKKEKNDSNIENRCETHDLVVENYNTEIAPTVENIVVLNDELASKIKSSSDIAISENQCNNDESQLMALYYGSDKPTKEEIIKIDKQLSDEEIIKNTEYNESFDHDFSDNEINYDDIDAMIENAATANDTKGISTPVAVNNPISLNTKPKITGTPGMVISLDGDDDATVRKPTGVELLKERFTYFAKLQNQEDMKKDREKKYKPGTQHIKLKQELEEQIAEQRSLEWTKRLEEEKLMKLDSKDVLSDDEGDVLDKIESQLEMEDDESGDENDDDLVEDDVDMSDKPKQRNAMVDDEAEVSDDENECVDKEANIEETTDLEKSNDELESESNDDSLSESEEESEESKPRKGRILKAFEDSDDEKDDLNTVSDDEMGVIKAKAAAVINDVISQDEDLQLAQANKSISEDMFPTQESIGTVSSLNKDNSESRSVELGTFSILDTLPNSEGMEVYERIPDSMNVITETQPCDANFDAIVGLCSGNFTDNLATTQIEKSQLTPSLEISDDVATMCTGKFYDNQLASQMDTDQNEETKTDEIGTKVTGEDINKDLKESKKNEERSILKGILDELDEPDFDKPKQNKYFPSNNESFKKKFVIESDDETNEPETAGEKIKKRRKKRKLEERALQISDDEESSINDEYESDTDDDVGDVDKVYEYDSEENEVEVKEKPAKKKRLGEFFENEAELTSEDEWVGSGDEDEAGLDRMEREEGDDEVFHQGKLQRELGEIHMREVMDQDKREVRLIQELLLEDADLGDGHRQRRFKWRNIDGEEETGTAVDEFGDTQQDEFESEEQWRKQRHEREMFLRKMNEDGENNEDVNNSINRTTIIKANLSSRTMSNLISDTRAAESGEKENSNVAEKKVAKDIPSPKKPFILLKQNYHGSLLTRGRGALARLAALATPLAGDDDAPKLSASARGNFVFTTNNEPKVQKRKAEINTNTPQLIKRMKTADNRKYTLFDRLMND